MSITKISPSVVDFDDGITITVDDNSDVLTLKSTDADENSGPRLALTRDSGSPADNDYIGLISFNADDGGGHVTRFGYMVGQIADASNTSEDGILQIHSIVGGTERNRINITSTETVFNEDSVDLDFRIESNGNANTFFIDGGNDSAIFGHGVKRENFYNSTYGAQLQIENFATVGNYIGIATTTNSNDANGGYIVMGTTRGTVGNSTTIAQNGDFFGSLSFQGADGNQLVEGASIAAQVDGVPGANDMPGSLQFRTTADGASTVTEHMRISNTGMVSLGTTAQNGGGWTERLQVAGNSTRSNCAFFTGYGGSAVTGFKTGGHSGAVNFAIFYNNNDTAVGSIQISNATSGTSVSYNTSSDHRLKENVTYDWDGLTKLKQLKPAQFNFKTDPDTTIDGFLAHEAQTVVPEAVTGTHNETEDVSNAVLNALGNVIDEGVTEDEWKAGKEEEKPKYAADTTWKAEHTKDVYQGIDQSKLVPLMVKAIQELEAKVKALEEA